MSTCLHLDKKSEDIFFFSPRTFEQHIYHLFHYLLSSFRQLHNSIFPKLYIFLSKELFQLFFAVFLGINIVFIKRIL